VVRYRLLLLPRYQEERKDKPIRTLSLASLSSIISTPLGMRAKKKKKRREGTGEGVPSCPTLLRADPPRGKKYKRAPSLRPRHHHLSIEAPGPKPTVKRKKKELVLEAVISTGAGSGLGEKESRARRPGPSPRCAGKKGKGKGGEGRDRHNPSRSHPTNSRLNIRAEIEKNGTGGKKKRGKKREKRRKTPVGILPPTSSL